MRSETEIRAAIDLLTRVLETVGLEFSHRQRVKVALGTLHWILGGMAFFDLNKTFADSRELLTPVDATATEG